MARAAASVGRTRDGGVSGLLVQALHRFQHRGRELRARERLQPNRQHAERDVKRSAPALVDPKRTPACKGCTSWRIAAAAHRVLRDPQLKLKVVFN
jgi:hypothetical protein